MHHVVTSTGVKQDYVESDPSVFFSKYEELYLRLKRGEKLIWNEHHPIATTSTGITKHLEICKYKPSTKLSVPNFLEPCPYISCFCFDLFDGTLRTNVSHWQFPENIVGLDLYVSTKIDYRQPSERHNVGIVRGEELADYATYQTILARIKAITKSLKLEIDGKLHRTSVRVSEEAKKDLAHFYFITQNNVKIL